MASNPWLPDRHPSPGAGLRLFCFAHAGGNASAFRSWRGLLPPAIELAEFARAEVVATLSRDVLSLFERVAHGRKGVAVAEARDGLCTVCHVRLRPQMFNEVRRNDGLHQCDSCTRILYYVPGAAPGGAAQPS